jgi:hypothetical protein
MKPFYLLLPLLLAFTAPTKPKRIVFFGDSITQAAVQPTGCKKYLPNKTAPPTTNLSARV